jgi:(p)ppGpp synthase/HD superfamily hydrolase
MTTCDPGPTSADIQDAIGRRVILTGILRVISSVAWSVSLDAEIQWRIKLLCSRTEGRHSGDQVPDLIGVRVIVREVEECYEVIHQIHSRFKFLESEYDDYVESPKPNGYRSLHTTLLTSNGHVFELQVRTRGMHSVAQTGSAAHWRYKQLQKASTTRGTVSPTEWQLAALLDGELPEILHRDHALAAAIPKESGA